MEAKSNTSFDFYDSLPCYPSTIFISCKNSYGIYQTGISASGIQFAMEVVQLAVLNFCHLNIVYDRLHITKYCLAYGNMAQIFPEQVNGKMAFESFFFFKYLFVHHHLHYIINHFDAMPSFRDEFVTQLRTTLPDVRRPHIV